MYQYLSAMYQYLSAMYQYLSAMYQYLSAMYQYLTLFLSLVYVIRQRTMSGSEVSNFILCISDTVYMYNLTLSENCKRLSYLGASLLVSIFIF